MGCRQVIKEGIEQSEPGKRK